LFLDILLVLDILHSIFINSATYWVKDYLQLLYNMQPVASDGAAVGQQLCRIVRQLGSISAIPAGSAERITEFMIHIISKLDKVSDKSAEPEKATQKKRRLTGNDGAEILSNISEVTALFKPLTTTITTERTCTLLEAHELMGLLLFDISKITNRHNYNDVEDVEALFNRLEYLCTLTARVQSLYFTNERIRPTLLQVLELPWYARQVHNITGGLGLMAVSAETVEHCHVINRADFKNGSNGSRGSTDTTT
jgi:hypothetical protein